MWQLTASRRPSCSSFRLTADTDFLWLLPITRIRASMTYLSAGGSGQSEETGVAVVLSEETVCLAIVDNAETW